jgi:hypothetical protein
VYKFNPVDPSRLKAPGFNPWNLYREKLVSRICSFKFNLCRYMTDMLTIMHGGGLYKLNAVDP